jgi:5'-phosphate synthase pdxT subunit
MLWRLHRDVIRVFSEEELKSIDALIMPGGESTTLIKFLDKLDLWDLIKNRINSGMPILGTCAGLILLAKDVQSFNQKSLGVLDIEVQRMGFGRQVDSFEACLNIPILGRKPLNGIFIRAPRITRVGTSVEILAELENEPVAIRSGHIWGTTFHPELTDDKRFHQEFIKMCESTVDVSKV